jgi:hypothetical protein
LRPSTVPSGISRAIDHSDQTIPDISVACTDISIDLYNHFAIDCTVDLPSTPPPSLYPSRLLTWSPSPSANPSISQFHRPHHRRCHHQSALMLDIAAGGEGCDLQESTYACALHNAR